MHVRRHRGRGRREKHWRERERERAGETSGACEQWREREVRGSSWHEWTLTKKNKLFFK